MVCFIHRLGFVFCPLSDIPFHSNSNICPSGEEGKGGVGGNVKIRKPLCLAPQVCCLLVFHPTGVFSRTVGRTDLPRPGSTPPRRPAAALPASPAGGAGTSVLGLEPSSHGRPSYTLTCNRVGTEGKLNHTKACFRLTQCPRFPKRAPDVCFKEETCTK